MARVLVTGGCGFVGSHLVEELVHRGDDVTVFDGGAPPPDQSLAGKVRYVAGDMRDRTQLSHVITDGVDVVYHLAAMVGVDRYLEQPLDVIDVNLLGTRRRLRLLLSHVVRKRPGKFNSLLRLFSFIECGRVR